MKEESQGADSQDVALPLSIVYNDSDPLAHPSVGSRLADPLHRTLLLLNQ